MYKFKKKIAFLLVVGLLLGSLTGCGTHAKQSSAQKGTEAEKGRYVETQIDLPEGVDSSQVF